MRSSFFLHIIFILIFIQGCCTFSTPPYKGPISDHFDGKQFFNIDIDSSKERSAWDLIKWNFFRNPGEWNDWYYSNYGAKPPERIPDGELRVTFINHSTVLLQYDNLNILTDPVWSYRVSPVSFLGPERKKIPGIKFEDLPPIDIVIISHNHYDHMDMPTLLLLQEKHNPLMLVPLGNKETLLQNGIDKVIERDWWEEFPNTNIFLVPSKHFSMRGACDRNTSLWGGFVLKTKKGPVYYSGDTGFGSHFEKIYQHFGPMRFSMLPIGAFKPRWFMAFVHISPEDALRAHLILHSKKSMGIHFGAISQTDDGDYEPIFYLNEALRKNNISEKDFFVIPEGDGIRIP